MMNKNTRIALIVISRLNSYIIQNFRFTPFLPAVTVNINCQPLLQDHIDTWYWAIIKYISWPTASYSELLFQKVHHETIDYWSTRPIRTRPGQEKNKTVTPRHELTWTRSAKAIMRPFYDRP
jgi:hypothetical protein